MGQDTWLELNDQSERREDEPAVVVELAKLLTLGIGRIIHDLPRGISVRVDRGVNRAT